MLLNLYFIPHILIIYFSFSAYYIPPTHKHIIIHYNNIHSSLNILYSIKFSVTLLMVFLFSYISLMNRVSKII